eukprot:9679107-Lingulodinium_polyedra.AAC.1
MDTASGSAIAQCIWEVKVLDAKIWPVGGLLTRKKQLMVKLGGAVAVLTRPCAAWPRATFVSGRPRPA